VTRSQQNNGGVTIVGGKNSTFIKDNRILPGRDEVICYPSPSKTHDVSIYLFPEATEVAWKKFIKSEILRSTGTSTLKTDSRLMLLYEGFWSHPY